MSHFAARSFGPGKTSCKIILGDFTGRRRRFGIVYFLRHVNIDSRTSRAGDSEAEANVPQARERRNKNHMKDSPGLHLKTYALIMLIVLFAPLGNVLLSKGMKGVGSAKNWTPRDIVPVFGSIITSGYIWLGIACLLTFFVAYMVVLSWADYSYVQPASSFSYAVVALLGYFLLGEAVPLLRWIGIFVICVGVFVVGHTHPRTTEKA
jgi:hypothetical protein